MSRPTSSIRYGTCAVHHTQPSYPVAICSAKRSPFTGALTPHGSIDPLELVGFATDSPLDLPPPPPPPPPPGLSDDGVTPAWMLVTGRRRLSTDTTSSTFGVGRCRVAISGPSSTVTCYPRRTTGTGPAGGPATSQHSGDGVISRTDSAPLPLSDYDEEDSGTAPPVDHRLLPPQVLPAQPAPVCERDCRSLKNSPRSLSTTTSVAICRL